MKRREFLRAVAGATAVAAARPAVTRAADAARDGVPQLEPVHAQTVCRWSAAHPRHDHQLIFALEEARLMLVWCEYYADRPALLARKPTDRTGQAGDEMPCRISAKLSTDRGRNWSGTMTLQENVWQRNVKHPNLMRLSENDIVFSFVGWDSAAARNVYVRRSADNGETWSPREQISEPGWYCNNADRAVRLASGRLLLPAHGPFAESYVGAEPYRGGKSKLHSFVFYSDDGGTKWRRSTDSMTAPGRGCHEPTIVELRDGRLLCFLRNSNGRLYRSFSEDEGLHWTTPAATELASPEAPSLVKRMPTGDLLLLWNDVSSTSNWPRTPLTAAVSTDEGANWRHVQDVDRRPDRDAAYPSVTFVGDEALVAYYTRPTNWARDSEVELRIYRLDQFYT